MSHPYFVSSRLRDIGLFGLIGLAIACNSSQAQTPTLGEVSGKVESTGSDAAISLFNGNDLTGWDGDPRLWSVRDGVIRGETTPENAAKGNTFLIWQGGTVADFELKLSFRCNDSNNSGIQYRSAAKPGAKARNPWSLQGYQHEVRNELKFPNIAGFIYDEGGKRGRVCLVGEKAVMRDGKKVVLETLIDEAGFGKLFRLDDWNDVTIRCEGNHIQHFMNDTLILDFVDSPELALTDGVLALQLHGGKPMWVEFRDLQLQKL